MGSRKMWIAVAAAAALLALAFWWWSGGGRPREEQVVLLDPAQVIVLRTPGGMLEVATIVKNEEFGWQASYTCPVVDCGQLLGHTVSRIRVPVHYVYRVPLAQQWELRLRDGEYVLALPPPEPKLPPAMDTSKAEIQTNGNWSSPSPVETTQGMLRNIVPELNRRALRPEYLALQRAVAEKTVAEFARKWMAEQVRTPQRPVRVVFKTADSG